MTLREALAAGTAILDKSQVSSPRLSAEVLLSHCLGVERPYLYAHDRDEMVAAHLDAYRSMLDRKSAGEPLQHITGTQEFFGRAFRVNSTVLIPRPETELVVETVCELNEWARARIVDVGTGSGCIGVTLALEIPDAKVFAVDVSPEGLGVARHNAVELGAEVALAAVDVLDAIGGVFEFVVSNPPYVACGDYPSLQKEVRNYEPHVALFAPDDTLSVYRKLIPQAKERLIGGGHLVVEIGFALEEGVRKLFGEDWELLPTRTDLQGIPRVVAARKVGK